MLRKFYIQDKKKDEGFTLVELIVVIVILAILIGVTIGGIYMYVGKARENTDINNASSIEKVLSTIIGDNDFLQASSKEYKNGWGTVNSVICWSNEIKDLNSLNFDAFSSTFMYTKGETSASIVKYIKTCFSSLPKNQCGKYFIIHFDYKNDEVRADEVGFIKIGERKSGNKICPIRVKIYVDIGDTKPDMSVCLDDKII